MGRGHDLFLGQPQQGDEAAVEQGVAAGRIDDDFLLAFGPGDDRVGVDRLHQVQVEDVGTLESGIGDAGDRAGILAQGNQTGSRQIFQGDQLGDHQFVQ